MNRTIRSTIPLFILLMNCFAIFAQEQPNGESAKTFVAYLASDALQGRDTGTPAYDKAAAWVAEKFKVWGLQPAGDSGAYFQEFPFSYFKDEFDFPKLTIGKRIFNPEDRDFAALNYSGSGKVQGEVVFVGFGVSAPDKGLDEYAGLDVEDKIVLTMHGCPDNDEKKWEGLFEDSVKVAVAQAKGASGILICASFGEEERGIGYWRLRPGNYRDKFIAFGVDERVVKFLLKKKDESNSIFQNRLREQFGKLNKELKPMSLATGKKASLAVKTEYDPKRKGKNVLGMIKGTDPAIGNETIVLGAHLDHVGTQYGQINNGADDNASGSATVMEVARVMMANKVQPKRTIIFACWGGEERGLLGSSYYAKNPTVPIEKTVLNFNMDMVGMGKKLGFPGIYYAPEIWKIIQAHADSATLAFIEPSRGGPGGSDHTPFVTRGVPAFALMTSPFDAHPDYHQPGDDTEKIDAAIMGKVAQFVYDNALLIANYDGNLMVENRLPIYIHKSANIINVHPIAYEKGLSLLDSLQNEWIDIQFVTVSLDSLNDPSARLAEMVTSLDAATGEESDISQMMGAMARMFRTR
ncbi:MAG TPA: M20/M25/M40 family metallo-hydrolase, partial [bacterium]